ncbi:hypothetical protein YT1_0283 [Rhodococcus ruber]|nr:hypothetical protein YT1_0283 [Rhodococcus ruber]
MGGAASSAGVVVQRLHLSPRVNCLVSPTRFAGRRARRCRFLAESAA